MRRKLSVALLGGTGLLGQTYAHLLYDHPWFELTYIGSSKKGIYADVIKESWLYPTPPPILPLRDSRDFPDVDLVFSTSGIDEIETSIARKGGRVISHAASLRCDPLIPLVIPEVNAHHLDVLPLQQKMKGWKGWIVSKPNCTLPSFLLPLYPLIQPFGLRSIQLTTLQSRSGIGIEALINNLPRESVDPALPSEELKTESEPLKILGAVTSQGIEPYSLPICAHCTRVPVDYGHLATVTAAFDQTPTVKEAIEIWESFPCLELPSYPKKLFKCLDTLYSGEVFSLKHDIAIGNVRSKKSLMFKGLNHNVLRGGAGGGLLIAEYLYSRGYFD